MTVPIFPTENTEFFDGINNNNVLGENKMKRNDVERTHVIFGNIIVVVLAVFTLVTGCKNARDEKSAPATTEQETVAVKPESPPTTKEEIIIPPTQEEITIPLLGEIGSSPHWGSGWIDLEAPTDFLKGDRIRIKVGGSASKILVRLLPKGRSPDTSTGLIGGTITVPEDRIVEVILKYDRKGIIQISVHGGPNPWNKPLGGGNGPATIEEEPLLMRSKIIQ